MNLISTSNLPGRTLGNLALAGSLFLHVGLFALYSSWQWNWTAPEKTPPKVVNVKFLLAPPSPPSAETPDSPKPTPMAPARPLTVQSNSKLRLMPRIPNLSIPTLHPVKMARQIIRSHKKIIKHPLTQPSSVAVTHLFSASEPVSFPRHNQRAVIHRRSPNLETQAAKFPDTPSRVAISTRPAERKFNIMRRLPNPAQSMAFLQADFVSHPEAEQPTSKETVNDKFATLPRDLPQSSPAAHEAVPEAGLNTLRGLFTGKVRQRIANAKYYPRIARRRGMEGQPVIAFTLDRSGRLMKTGLAETSGYQLLDQAALEAVHRAAPYPEIPAELNMDIFQFKLPISFVLK